MKEAGVVIDLQGRPLYWHAPEDRTVGSLPDSHDLWEILWENREILAGFGHSHPGSGQPGPSHTDVTTFAAIESGLGKRLDWWITSSDKMSVCRWVGPGRLTYAPIVLVQEPSWADRLRAISAGLTGPQLETRRAVLNYLLGKGSAPTAEQVQAIRQEWQM